MLQMFREQPRAFHMIFMLEIWERFGFYTVQGILTLFFIRFLGFDDSQAYYTFGAYSALVYGMVALGGYLGDKVLGTKRTIVLGLVVLALGYLALSFSNKQTVFLALSLICVGNGLFKANPSSLLSKCYQENDPRLHGAFTLYYMAINLGSTSSLFIGPYLSSHYGYSYAYFVSFIGLLLALANYWFQRQYVDEINTNADKRVIKHWQWTCLLLGIVGFTVGSAYLLEHVELAKKLLFVVTLCVVAVYIGYMFYEKKHSFAKMTIALVLMIEAIIFFTLYQQMFTSVNLFAVNNVRPFLFGISIDPQSFQALNPIWIIAMSPVLAGFYRYLNRYNVSFTIPYKFAAGMLCCSISFLLLYFARFAYDASGMVSSSWLVTSYLFQSTGELFVSALGVAMVAELVPTHLTGFVMGMWFLTSSIAGFIGATVASYAALPQDLQPGVESLMVYTQVFVWIGLVTFFLSILMWWISAYLERFISHKPENESDDVDYNILMVN